MSLHLLKCDPEPFQAIWKGDKLCEIRKNDRNYCVGDWVDLYQQNERRTFFTGRHITAIVSHVQCDYGLKEGYVALSLQRISRYRRPINVRSFSFEAVSKESVFVPKAEAEKWL